MVGGPRVSCPPPLLRQEKILSCLLPISRLVAVRRPVAAPIQLAAAPRVPLRPRFLLFCSSSASIYMNSSKGSWPALGYLDHAPWHFRCLFFHAPSRFGSQFFFGSALSLIN